MRNETPAAVELATLGTGEKKAMQCEVSQINRILPSYNTLTNNKQLSRTLDEYQTLPSILGILVASRGDTPGSVRSTGKDTC